MNTLAAIVAFAILGAIVALCPTASPAPLPAVALPKADITLAPVVIVGSLRK